tara:strand:+ start:1012 stop:1992 length:981 start_codon:yes stop_codon:yes gene_type:complete
MGSEQSLPVESDKKEKDSKKNIFNILNVYADIPDYRDLKYELTDYEKNLAVKDELDLRNNYDSCKVFNSNEGCNIACSISTIIYNELKKNGEELMLPSINFIFYNSILTEYNTNVFTDIKHLKLSLRNSLKSLNKYGICSEECLPSEDILCIPYENCYAFGKYFNFKYSRVDNDILTIKKILNNNKGILINLTVYTSFLKEKMKKEGTLDFPDEYDSLLGMISGVIVGYTEKKIIIKSCFGEEWGDKGYFYIDYNYLEKLCNDSWLIEVFIDKKKKFGLNFDINIKNSIVNFNQNNSNNNINTNNSEITTQSKNSSKNMMLRGSVF